MGQECKVLQNKLKNNVEEYERIRSELEGKYVINKSSIREKVEEKCAQLDRSSDDLSNEFVSGNINLSRFLEEFLEARKKYHALATKLRSIS